MNVKLDAENADVSVLDVLLTAPNENGCFGLSTSSTLSSFFLLFSSLFNAVSDFTGCDPNENLTSDGAGSETVDETLLPNEN